MPLPRPSALILGLLTTVFLAGTASGVEVQVPPPREGNDIQPALEQAFRDATPPANGDTLTVVLPAGSFHLEGNLRIDLRRWKRLTLRGQGKNRTRLIKHKRSAATRFMVEVSGRSQPDLKLEVVGITFQGAPSGELDEANEQDDIGLRLTRCGGVTVHHCRFTSFGHAAIQVRHDLASADVLIYNNEFVGNHHPDPRPDPVTYRERVSSLGYGVEVRADLATGTGTAADWLAEPGPGSPRFVFVEDNYFNGHRHAIAGGEGGLYVFRNNLVESHFTAQAVDAHGAFEHNNQLSTRFYEVYRNRLVSATQREALALGYTTAPNFGIAFRGGEGLAFDNALVGFPTGFRLSVEARAASYPTPFQIGWESAANHQPGPDHRGVSPLALIKGDVFLWGNTSDGRPDTTPHVNREDAQFLIQGRDYHFQPRPAYVPYRYPHPRAENDPRRLPFPDGMDADTDGDGAKNIDEFYRDTDPNRAGS